MLSEVKLAGQKVLTQRLGPVLGTGLGNLFNLWVLLRVDLLWLSLSSGLGNFSLLDHLHERVLGRSSLRLSLWLRLRLVLALNVDRRGRWLSHLEEAVG